MLPPLGEMVWEGVRNREGVRLGRRGRPCCAMCAVLHAERAMSMHAMPCAVWRKHYIRERVFPVQVLAIFHLLLARMPPGGALPAGKGAAEGEGKE